MQTLDVISVNLWQILISLLNLFLLFLIVKRFLFQPVKAVLASRQKELDARYASAEAAEQHAFADRRNWEAKMQQADARVNTMLQNAADQAKYRGETLLAEAQSRADSIIRLARNEAELERRKAGDAIKREIVEVSGALAQKMLEREIHTDDHRNLIESFINKMGDGHD